MTFSITGGGEDGTAAGRPSSRARAGSLLSPNFLLWLGAFRVPVAFVAFFALCFPAAAGVRGERRRDSLPEPVETLRVRFFAFGRVAFVPDFRLRGVISLQPSPRGCELERRGQHRNRQGDDHTASGGELSEALQALDGSVPPDLDSDHL